MFAVHFTAIDRIKCNFYFSNNQQKIHHPFRIPYYLLPGLGIVVKEYRPSAVNCIIAVGFAPSHIDSRNFIRGG